jgi:hypothetical protein
MYYPRKTEIGISNTILLSAFLISQLKVSLLVPNGAHMLYSAAEVRAAVANSSCQYRFAAAAARGCQIAAKKRPAGNIEPFPPIRHTKRVIRT